MIVDARKNFWKSLFEKDLYNLYIFYLDFIFA